MALGPLRHILRCVLLVPSSRFTEGMHEELLWSIQWWWSLSRGERLEGLCLHRKSPRALHGYPDCLCGFSCLASLQMHLENVHQGDQIPCA